METMLQKKSVMYHWVRGKFSADLKEDKDITQSFGGIISLGMHGEVFEEKNEVWELDNLWNVGLWEYQW